MSQLHKKLWIIVGVCSLMTCVNTQAETTTEVNPDTQESKTTTVNPVTSDSMTTIVKPSGETTTTVEGPDAGTQQSSTTVNPTTQESSTTVVNPVTKESTTTNVNPNTQQATITQNNPSTGVSKTTIVSLAPAAEEATTIPAGYANCFKVAAGWYKSKWISEHDVCQYDASKGVYQGSAWIGGHWTCPEYRIKDGVCTKWTWQASRWVSSCEVF
jgi:uncharacterized membrane protein